MAADWPQTEWLHDDPLHAQVRLHHSLVEMTFSEGNGTYRLNLLPSQAHALGVMLHDAYRTAWERNEHRTTWPDPPPTRRPVDDVLADQIVDLVCANVDDDEYDGMALIVGLRALLDGPAEEGS